jgi:hypothetical protein
MRISTATFTTSAGATVLALLVGCTGHVPYRTGGLAPNPSCAAVYRAASTNALSGDNVDWSNPCWLRSIEEHDRFDLVTIEFDDQGWVQDGHKSASPSGDYLTEFFAKLETIYQQERQKGRGLSIVVFTHGWKHNAKPDDGDVQAFRAVLRDLAAVEDFLVTKGSRPMRVVGIYVGWRGASLDIPLLRELTFWDRKNTAHAIANGMVREMFKHLDHFRDRSRGDGGDRDRDIRMLTVGHSFGGLITYESMSGEFVRNSVRFREQRPNQPPDRFMSRVGDLVVIVNPAFEGARYESIRVAAVRNKQYETNQAPVSLVVTSRGDWATRYFFPLARFFSTLFEAKPGAEAEAVIKAVGHNERYITHELALCQKDDARCRTACAMPSTQQQFRIGALTTSAIEAEYEYIQRAYDKGFRREEHLCGLMHLRAAPQWQPASNPYWVVRTTDEIIDDHSDLFNPNFVTFVRQIYLGFIYTRVLAPRP